MVKLLTRDEYHKQKGKVVFGEEDCPFCYIEKQQESIVWKGKNWYILHNISPYSGTDKHIMAVPYKHKKFFYELDSNELLELNDISIFVKNFFGEDNYFSCIRETMANRSVEHLHIHYVPGKLQGKFLRKMLEGQGFPIVEHLE